MLSLNKVPHPFPYQGSKRGIARHILTHFPTDIHCLVEPFCGAAAVSLAAAANGLASKFHLNDLNKPLMILWREILDNPTGLADKYEDLWHDQEPDKKDFFLKIRKEFNKTHQPHLLQYLLARIVKGAVRYSSDGAFNQSADNRRAGMRPGTMRKQISGVSGLLSGKTIVTFVDFREVLDKCGSQDLVYMDPPYQGTSFTRDHRYWGGLLFEDFVDALERLNENYISYIISYDGYTGDKAHGKALPQHLRLKHLFIEAGRSSQSTLLGGSDKTVESLYLSPALVVRLRTNKQRSCALRYREPQLALI